MKINAFIIKPVGSRCNLACTYCYHRLNRCAHNPAIMSSDILYEIFRQASEHAEGRIHFIWHGGEPLLAGKRFFENAIDIQRRHGLAGRTRNSIQTNGVLLDNQWVAFLKSNNFYVGVSLDGEAEVHNACRISPSGSGSFDQTMKGIRLLSGAGIRFGLGSVITSSHRGTAKGWYSFMRQTGADGFDLSPCFEISQTKPKSLAEYCMTPTDYADFAKSVFDQWYAEDNPSVRISHFEDAIRRFLGGSSRLCSSSRQCFRYPAFDINGDVYYCGRFLGEDQMKIGNILSTNLSNMMTSSHYTSLARSLNTILDSCKACKWRSICNGGCSYFTRNDNIVRQAYCESSSRLLEAISGRIFR